MGKRTIDTVVTDADIISLADAAAVHGDAEMETICISALAGNAAARTDCEKVIRDVRWLELEG